jgi:anti-sigma regulatory factor (Ser/Thr protein kinase)
VGVKPGIRNPNPRWSTDLTPGASASREARWFLWQTLADRPLEQVQLAALLTTEVISIATRHSVVRSQRPIRVTASVDSGRVKVAVRDRGWGFRIGEHSDARDDIWGLMLLAKLSSRWGVDRLAAGTYIWFD